MYFNVFLVICENNYVIYPSIVLLDLFFILLSRLFWKLSLQWHLHYFTNCKISLNEYVQYIHFFFEWGLSVDYRGPVYQCSHHSYSSYIGQRSYIDIHNNVNWWEKMKHKLKIFGIPHIYRAGFFSHFSI